MLETKVLVVSLTSFFGGGESFILKTLSHLSANMYYLVASEDLANELPKDKTKLFQNTSIFKNIHEVYQFMRVIKPDWVILNGGRALFFSPFLHNSKILAYRHSTDDSIQCIIKKWLYILATHVSYAFSDKIVHVSEYAFKQQKIFKKKATYIHHGLDIKEQLILKKNKEVHAPINFLFLGRTEPAKGIEIIVKAFMLLPKGKAKLNIVGVGSSSEWLSNLNYADINYFGFTKDVVSYYQNNDVFITLPEHEAFGLTIIEAMYNSLPVIACAQGGIPEIVLDGSTGVLVDRNIESVLQAMILFCDNSLIIKKMGQEAFDRCIKKFNKSITISKIDKLLKE